LATHYFETFIYLKVTLHVTKTTSYEEGEKWVLQKFPFKSTKIKAQLRLEAKLVPSYSLPDSWGQSQTLVPGASDQHQSPSYHQTDHLDWQVHCRD